MTPAPALGAAPEVGTLVTCSQCNLLRTACNIRCARLLRRPGREQDYAACLVDCGIECNRCRKEAGCGS